MGSWPYKPGKEYFEEHVRPFGKFYIAFGTLGKKQPSRVLLQLERNFGPMTEAQGHHNGRSSKAERDQSISTHSPANMVQPTESALWDHYDKKADRGQYALVTGYYNKCHMKKIKHGFMLIPKIPDEPLTGTLHRIKGIKMKPRLAIGSTLW